jgi:hypothetical protein
LWQRRPDTGARLEAAVRATDPARVSPDALPYVLDVVVPEMSLLAALLGPGDFAPALARAVARHKHHWSGEEARSPLGWIALGPTALAAFAHDRGLPTEVDSDFVPRRLVEGMCAERVVVPVDTG